MSDERELAPVVLAHGLFGFRRLGVGPLTIIPYFREIPELLRGQGRRVLVTQVPSIGDLDERANALGRQIESELGGMRFHIIGHSTGGLDSRVLLSRSGWRNRAISLICVGTPHLGTSLADAGLSYLSPLLRVLDVIGVNRGGFRDISRRKARRFARKYPNPGEYPCYSFAGEPDVAELCHPLRPLHSLMERWEGANDGLVGVESALGYGVPLFPRPIDHLRQMNWMTSSSRQSRLRERVLQLYRDFHQLMLESEREDAAILNSPEVNAVSSAVPIVLSPIESALVVSAGSESLPAIDAPPASNR